MIYKDSPKVRALDLFASTGLGGSERNAINTRWAIKFMPSMADVHKGSVQQSQGRAAT